jgi:predicted nucleic acid-binding protein
MHSCDTNILLYYLDDSCEEHSAAKNYFSEKIENRDFVICDLVLVELFILLQNKNVFKSPYDTKSASHICLELRSNPNWKVLEYSIGTMEPTWKATQKLSGQAYKIFDYRLGYTLLRAGVTNFATRNVKDFKEIGFKNLHNPID